MMTRRWMVVAATLVGLGGAVGCDSDGGTDAGVVVTDAAGSDAGGSDAGGATTDAGGTDSGTTSVPGGTVRGVITRTAGLTMPEDGRGTIYIDVGPECPYATTFAGATTGRVENADMNDPNVQIPYEVTGLAPGTYYVWAWLDDNGDTIDATPFPQGDPGNFPVCPQVTVTATEGATADLEFNSII